MKQRIIVLFTALMLCIGAKAATVQVIDGLKYIIYTSQKYAVLTADDYSQSKIDIPANITWNGKKYPVTGLEDECFSGCSRLISVNIPSSVTSLGKRCFSDCRSLTSVNIPSSVTSLEYGCFNNCSSLTSVNIPSSVISLGSGCFEGCSSLTSVNIPSSVTSLGSGCFGDCLSLTSVNIPSSVTSLEDYCFSGCQNLRSVNIPSSVTSLGERCFYNCRSLESVNIPSSVTSLGDNCFTWCTILRSVNIPSSVTSLGKGCFSNCSRLTSVNIPSSVTSLENSCFQYCSSLISVNIPSSVTSLRDYCFYKCSSLTSVNIQSPSIELGKECFASTGIDEFTIMAPTPPSLYASKYNSDGYCFKDCIIDKAQLMVPKGSVDSYKAAEGWNKFGYILPIGGSGQPGKCETPRISYASGKLQFDSSTPGAEYHYTIKVSDACTDALTKGNVSLAACYDISCYATADGYTVSKTSTARLYWISANMATDGIAPATQMRGVVVSTEGGIVTLSGLKENERVEFYSVSGMKLGETRALNGQASISAPDDMIIARIGNQAIKVKR